MLTRKLDDALRLLVFVARCHPDPVRSEITAAWLRADPSQVRHLVGRLKRAGLVRVRYGDGGGALLARPPSAIDLAAVLAAVSPAPFTVRPRVPGPGPFCTLRNVLPAFQPMLARAAQAFTDVLAGLTLADLLNEVRGLDGAEERHRHLAKRARWLEAQAGLAKRGTSG